MQCAWRLALLKIHFGRFARTVSADDLANNSPRLVHRLRPLEGGQRRVNPLRAFRVPSHQSDRRQDAHRDVRTQLHHRVLKRGDPLILVVRLGVCSHGDQCIGE